jgi:hypothetical protein
MSELLQQARCSVDFANDELWEDDRRVRTNGLNVATTVRDLLKSAGVELGDPEEHEEHGWELNGEWKGQRFWVQVTMLDPQDVYILTKHSFKGMFARWRGEQSAYPEFLRILHELLLHDGRFHEVLWYPFVAQPGRPGSATPTG